MQFLATSLVYLKLKIEEVLTYRVVIVSWGFVAAIPLMVAASIFLYSETRSPTLGGYSRDQIIAYYLLFFFLQQIFSSYVFFSTMDDIINGQLSVHLVKPFPYFMRRTIDEVGWRMMDTIIRLPLLIAVAVVAKQYLGSALPIPQLGLVALSILIGLAIYHLIAFLFGLLAFWFTHIESFHYLYFIVFLLFSGEMMPVHLYPEPFATVVRLLPFRYIYSFPVELYLGKLSSAEIAYGMVLSLTWLFLLARAWVRVWRKGLVSYGAYGG